MVFFVGFERVLYNGKNGYNVYNTSMLRVSYKDKNTALNFFLIKWILEQCYLYCCGVYDIDLKHI